MRSQLISGPARCLITGKEETTSTKICWYFIGINFRLQKVGTRFKEATLFGYMRDGDRNKWQG